MVPEEVWDGSVLGLCCGWWCSGVWNQVSKQRFVKGRIGVYACLGGGTGQGGDQIWEQEGVKIRVHLHS